MLAPGASWLCYPTIKGALNISGCLLGANRRGGSPHVPSRPRRWRKTDADPSVPEKQRLGVLCSLVGSPRGLCAGVYASDDDDTEGYQQGAT